MKTKKERINMKKYGIISLLLLILTVLPLIGCGGETTTTPVATTTTPAVTTPAATTTTPAAVKPVSGGTLRYIIDQSPSGSLGLPEKMWSSMLYMALCTEPLVKVDSQGTPTPLLAETWDWSDDGLTLTINLRQGVKFHDGSAFNADVCVWNLERGIAAFSGGSANIASVKKTGDYKVQIVIKAFDNTWFSNLRGTLGMMISKKQYDEKGADYCDFHPCGAGPFIFSEYVENDHLSFVRNDNYWGKKPYLDGVVFTVIVDSTTAQLAFENGEADILGNVTGGGKAANVLKEKGYSVTASPGGISYVLVPSVTNPESPLSNVKVRQAIEYAIDKEAIAQNLGDGYYTAMYQCAGPVQPVYDPNFKGRKYNVATAKALLKEAGYESGFSTKLIESTSHAGDEGPAIQAMLADVGITIEIELISINQWIDLETNGWPEGLLLSPHAYSELYGIDVDRYFTTPTTPIWGPCYFHSAYRTQELEDLCTAYGAIPLGPQEVAKGREIVKWLFDNVTFVPLWDQLNIAIRQTTVRDIALPFAAGPIGWDYCNTWLATK
jgi:peptide/nickel transport system substrate-binding protein